MTQSCDSQIAVITRKCKEYCSYTPPINFKPPHIATPEPYHLPIHPSGRLSSLPPGNQYSLLPAALPCRPPSLPSFVSPEAHVHSALLSSSTCAALLPFPSILLQPLISPLTSILPAFLPSPHLPGHLPAICLSLFLSTRLSILIYTKARMNILP
jgi:hypothetical protein